MDLAVDLDMLGEVMLCVYVKTYILIRFPRCINFISKRNLTFFNESVFDHVVRKRVNAQDLDP